MPKYALDTDETQVLEEGDTTPTETKNEKRKNKKRMEQAEEETATDDEVVQPVDLHEDQAAYLMGDHGQDSQVLSPTTASPRSVISASDADVPTTPKPSKVVNMAPRPTTNEPQPRPKIRPTCTAHRKHDTVEKSPSGLLEEISDMSDDAKPSGKVRSMVLCHDGAPICAAL